MEVLFGAKGALRPARELVGDELRAACYAAPRGSLMRQSLAGGLGGALGAVAANAVAGGSPSRLPRAVLLVLTHDELIVYAARPTWLGFGRPRHEEWRRFPLGTYTGTTERGALLQRLTLQVSPEETLKLEVKHIGVNRSNLEAIEAILTSRPRAVAV